MSHQILQAIVKINNLCTIKLNVYKGIFLKKTNLNKTKMYKIKRINKTEINTI